MERQPRTRKPREEAKVPHVLKALNAVMLELTKTGVGKNRKNNEQNFKYRSIEDVIDAAAPLLAEKGILVLPSYSNPVFEMMRTQSGNSQLHVVVEARFTFKSIVDGSSEVVTFYGEGMDLRDKATNKAMAAAQKYCITQTLSIPYAGMTDGDAGDKTEPVAGSYPEPKVSERRTVPAAPQQQPPQQQQRPPQQRPQQPPPQPPPKPAAQAPALSPAQTEIHKQFCRLEPFFGKPNLDRLIIQYGGGAKTLDELCAASAEQARECYKQVLAFSRGIERTLALDPEAVKEACSKLGLADAKQAADIEQLKQLIEIASQPVAA